MMRIKMTDEQAIEVLTSLIDDFMDDDDMHIVMNAIICGRDAILWRKKTRKQIEEIVRRYDDDGK